MIAIVVDKLNSGLGIAATSRAQTNSDIQVIPALDFQSHLELMKFLVEQSFSHIIFSWRESFADLYTIHSNSFYWHQLRQRSFLSVCFADLNFFVSEKSRVDFVCLTYSDLILATSPEIKKKIRDSNRALANVELFRDLPNRNNLISATTNIERIYDIIWVGNSTWGKNRMIKDHKRFHGIVRPLFERLVEINPSFKCIFIDLADGFVSNREVVGLISQSKILIQASRSEGTGLPVLEAMALGTVPISTPVGVGQYLLDAFPECLVPIDPTVEDYIVKIQNIYESERFDDVSQKLINCFNSYSKICALDTMNLKSYKAKNYNPQIPERFYFRVLCKLKWKVRAFNSDLRSKSSKGK
jgi:glycosyltransferase involved in cell wall biosynthesis